MVKKNHDSFGTQMTVVGNDRKKIKVCTHSDGGAVHALRQRIDAAQHGSRKTAGAVYHCCC
jgi:hypothetical protein